ncbi:bifunctional diaminohydroxyphosphoribosylaminopyrimidine deaminase/5-amino-6-(5-phosphoribosylamino)uracil reductase RibD [Intestinibacter sp.]|uniref:bifunctional diaminohydroxyphosphoribosylaminopyrimidine deaminase/5-amino-6-(5-phosphoribosylamino)uracil reductase RibD n=1 Tax=Intestinibacter sp. TaxID=1965304 RepID=UPI003F14F842
MKFDSKCQEDNYYMKKALALAKLGIGFVNPNPLVGCVIVKDGNIIGQGYHMKYGEAHAEVNAINSATEDIQGATVYVTLEPCSHYGKTPPCADNLVRHKVGRVVICNVDTNPLVGGKGIKKLKENGIEVTTGVLEEEGLKINEVFFHYINKNRPLIVSKTAISMDGKIATKHMESQWISNEKSRQMTHEFRNKYMAIMVGINTVLKDNPSLTTRIENRKTRNPIRIVVDTSLKIPMDSNLVQDKNAKTIVFTCNNDLEKINCLNKKDVDVYIAPKLDGKVDLNFVVEKLGKLKIDSVLVEGGATLNDSLFRNNLVDKVKIFMAPKIIGGKDAPSFVSGEGIEKLRDATNLKIQNITMIDEDVLIEADVIK